MTQALTKAEELSALRRLAEERGPNSYLGPWLQDALLYLSDSLRSDIHPISALQLHQQATDNRMQGMLTMQKAQTEARELWIQHGRKLMCCSSKPQQMPNESQVMHGKQSDLT